MAISNSCLGSAFPQGAIIFKTPGQDTENSSKKLQTGREQGGNPRSAGPDPAGRADPCGNSKKKKKSKDFPPQPVWELGIESSGWFLEPLMGSRRFCTISECVFAIPPAKYCQ